MRPAAVAMAVLLAALAPRSGFAAPLPDERLFDPPLANQELAAGTGLHAAEAVRCHWYADFMLRETGTDSPGTGPSTIVMQEPGGNRAPCRRAPGERDIKLDLQSQTFLGCKGSFVVFETTDAPGAEPFVVLHVPDGRKVYSDQKSEIASATSKAGLQEVSLSGDALHLRYLRAFDAPCSLLTDGAACWSKAMQQGHFTRAIAAQAPPIEACRAAYKASGDAAKITSTLVYDVEVMIPASGKASVLSRGAVGCLPAP